MSNLFDDSDHSDTEEVFKVNNEYAKNYNTWRQKEELNKLKTKYGEAVLESSDDEDSGTSSDEDSDGALITEEFERDFFKTLANLKKKDPKIYDVNVQFFKDLPAGSPQKSKKPREEPLFIKDYERKRLLEKGSNLSDDESENENSRARSPTYVEEQIRLVDELKKGLIDIDDKEDDTFKVREKSREEITKEEKDYKQWLLGQKEVIEDPETQNELKPLKDFWTDPKLDKNEQFLRDYILNKRFLGNEDKDYVPSYEEIVHDSDEGISEDEREVERQDDFEHKYNYRFEEPDAEFIKRYPRTTENSVRKKDDRRKQKRVETKERKQKEKGQKMEEIRKLKELKRKEIEEKIQKLKEITGNTDVDFQDDDIDGDFDPEAHDKRMQSLFNESFYQDEEGEGKPKFPELDEELEIENWDRPEEDLEQTGDDPHCEDDDFIMDCDYDPNKSEKDLINTEGRKKRKRKSKFAKLVQEPKPIYDPSDKTYAEYLDEYYKLDCEDIIGDIPCRFKYREVVPNSFGLTIEEILMAKDRELNKWCSLKKAIQIRPDHVEQYDIMAYNKKAKNEMLKKKTLSSLYQEENEPQSSTSSQQRGKKRKGKPLQSFVDYAEVVDELSKIDHEQENVAKTEEMLEREEESKEIITRTQKKKKKNNKRNHGGSGNTLNNTTEEEVETIKLNEVENKKLQEDISKAESKDKRKKRKSTEANKNPINVGGRFNKRNIKKKGKRMNSETDMGENTKYNKTTKKARKENANAIDISDSRLLAFGIKPKKFKNKMKYGQKQ